MKTPLTGHQITIIIFFIGVIILRALGYNSVTEYVILAIVTAELGIDFIPRIKKRK